MNYVSPRRKGLLFYFIRVKILRRADIKNWRPISLMNADYKILAKVISSRLKNVIKDIVNPNQMGFIKGRNIAHLIRELDNILFRRFSELFILSIDFEKAFDTT